MDCVFIKIDNVKYEVISGLTLEQIIKKYLPTYKNALIGAIDNTVCDLTCSVTKDSEVKFYDFDSKEGQETFWHSSAHVLGKALTRLYKCKLVNGPATEEGFYYDIECERPISSDDFAMIEKEMNDITKAREQFEKVVRSKKQLKEFYADNEFKQHFVEKFVEKETTMYKNGEFYDMCLGPHVRNTGVIKAIKLTKTSSAYFLNDATKPSLQRIYGISFPTQTKMKEYLTRIEKAREMDHRKIGRELGLFFFNKYSTGSCFWLPEGAHVYNKLIEYLRSEYKQRGFKEVITPNIYSIDLWKESGHYENYKENIYMVENGEFGLKPMNCPGHCLIFRHGEHTFRELPIRYADFGVLHRNECTGSLTGLSRVRRFQQDDGHIFCTRAQIEDEIAGCIDFLKSVYTVFGFDYELLLSTRPEKYIGKAEEWDHAEEALRNAIVNSGHGYTLNEGDGAFYGPKIDVILKDAFGRRVQCATVQLDFQLPQRFNLKYTGLNGETETPVIIHRAILGSLERMISILLESFGKKLPFWLSPRQIAIVPIQTSEYVEKVAERLRGFELRVFDKAGVSLNKNIRLAETTGYKIVCVIGKKEAENEEINVRMGKSNLNMSLDNFIEIIKASERNKTEINEAIFRISELTISKKI